MDKTEIAIRLRGLQSKFLHCAGSCEVDPIYDAEEDASNCLCKDLFQLVRDVENTATSGGSLQKPDQTGTGQSDR